MSSLEQTQLNNTLVLPMVNSTSALKQMTVEEVKQRFSILTRCADFEHIDRESYIEGVYQSLLAFCPVDSPALSALLILKIEFLSF